MTLAEAADMFDPSGRAQRLPTSIPVEDIMTPLSPLRFELCSFPRAYACAVQRRAATGRNQFIVRTGDPIQPFRVTATLSDNDEDIVLLVA